MSHYNRKERRRIAKMLGLHGMKVDTITTPEGEQKQVKYKESREDRLERVWRAAEVGRNIETQFTQQVENSVREQLLAKEAQALGGLTAIVGEEKAREILLNNYKNEQERISDLLAREERRKLRI
jgi:hypothetical protein